MSSLEGVGAGMPDAGTHNDPTECITFRAGMLNRRNA